jgi:hypothetical protein
MIVPKDSVPRTLPRNMSPKQALVFDGICVAAESADRAHQRLPSKLTQIGVTGSLPPELGASEVMVSARHEARSSFIVVRPDEPSSASRSR